MNAVKGECVVGRRLCARSALTWRERILAEAGYSDYFGSVSEQNSHYKQLTLEVEVAGWYSGCV